jgi:hypothetical protein
MKIPSIKVTANAKNQYDLPFYYLGQVLEATFEYESPTSLSPLGDKNGYQHLYLEVKGTAASDNIQFTWLSNNRFYTLTSATSQHKLTIGNEVYRRSGAYFFEEKQ